MRERAVRPEWRDGHRIGDHEIEADPSDPTWGHVVVPQANNFAIFNGTLVHGILTPESTVLGRLLGRVWGGARGGGAVQQCEGRRFTLLLNWWAERPPTYPGCVLRDTTKFADLVLPPDEEEEEGGGEGGEKGTARRRGGPVQGRVALLEEEANASTRWRSVVCQFQSSLRVLQVPVVGASMLLAEDAPPSEASEVGAARRTSGACAAAYFRFPVVQSTKWQSMLVTQ